MYSFTMFRTDPCTPYHRPVREVGSVPRLVTPRTVAHTSRHFGCFEQGKVEDFGPILQRDVSKRKRDSVNIFSQTLKKKKIFLPTMYII